MTVSAIPFVQARNVTKGRSNHIDVLVIHTMKSPEKSDTAESVANWFAGSTEQGLTADGISGPLMSHALLAA